MILGTAGYMAPEQARGRAVDKRADIWAFGVVLYQMLTGEKLFDGETIADTALRGAEERARLGPRSCESQAPVAKLPGERSQETAA